MKKGDAWMLFLLACALILLRAWMLHAGGFDLHFDEAQYWEWSQQLDWGYYSKGPMVAWLIALGESLFGHGEWQTRLAAWVCSGLFVILAYFFARDVWRSRAAGWWAALLALTTPLFFVLGMAITTDILMFTCWMWAMWACWRALEKRQSRAWYEAGIATGLGLLTKLTIGLLPLLTLMLMIVMPQWRGRWRDPHLWGGGLILVVFMLPVIGWNAANDWVTFRHSAGHVEATTFSPMGMLRFIAGQALVLSPLVVLAAVTLLWRRPDTPGQRYLWYVSVLCLLFFLFKSATGQVNLNWAAASYIGFLVLLAGHMPRADRWRRGLIHAGIVMSLLLISVVMFPLQFGIAGDRDPFKTMKGWQQAIQALANNVPQAEFIITTNYYYAGELSFYWPHRIPVYIVKEGRRFNQHDLWPGLEREEGNTGVFIDKYNRVPEALDRAFDHCRKIAPVKSLAADGREIRGFYPMLCEGYKHIDWPEPGEY